MKLATRVSGVFLLALAIILTVNSGLMFAVARFYLVLRFDEQLTSSLHTLVAAVEVEDDDVKWEATDHLVTLGTESGVEDVRWVVFDERGRVAACSANLNESDPSAAAVIEAARRFPSEPDMLPGWRMDGRRLAAPNPKPASERAPLEHEALRVMVARSQQDLNSTLWFLAGILVVLPAGVWLAAAIGGRWIIGQAIAPVRQMAGAARRIRADDTTARLPVPRARDELQELARAFNELLDQLFVEYDRQRRFAGDAAHQLRTPLTVMQGQVELALRRPRTADEHRATLQIVADEVGTMKQAVEALLFLARSGREPSPPDLQTIEAAEWLPQRMQAWHEGPRGRDLSLAVDRGWTCVTSPALLGQLLDILLSNACKYSAPGSPVQVRMQKLHDRWALEVADRGAGIADDDRSAIFEPFFRSSDARGSGIPGTGLGLAIAARIAAALGGEIRCESVLGEGSRFCFTGRDAGDDPARCSDEKPSRSLPGMATPRGVSEGAAKFRANPNAKFRS